MPLRFGAFAFDPDRRQLVCGGEEVHLPPRTLRFLELLLEARPRALSKRELMKQIWPDVVVEESNLKTIASELRAAIDDRDRSVIRTVQRYGYAFAADVVRDDGSRGTTYMLLGENLRVSVSRAEAVIGRHPGCDVWIDSPEVSRRHARITAEPERVVIEDLGSKNGTRVGLRTVSEPTELHDSDRISLGDVTLVFRTASPDESTRSAHQSGT